MKKKKELPQVEPVKIQPLFGLKPGVWLTIAYLIAILVVLFLIGILPDIINGSKRVEFTSAAYNAAVYVDGTYEGGTPFTRRIPSGVHEVVYEVDGNEIDRFQVKVGHPVFFNWLFPRTQRVSSEATLTKEAFEALSKELLEDAGSYGAILEYDDVHRYADIFTTYARSIAGSAYEKDTKALECAFLFITTKEMYDDALNAAGILGLDIEIDASKLFAYGAGASSVGTTLGNPSIDAQAASLKTDSFEIAGFAIPSATFSNGKAAECSYPSVKQAGRVVSTEPFNISSICITENLWAHFVKENPQWSASNKESLIEQGLVDEYYLDGVTLSTSVASNRPVRNISWHSAKAFCSWLSAKTGLDVDLPTEDQWIAATLTGAAQGYQKSLMPSIEQSVPSAMLGGVWEMTDTCFVPLSRISANGEDAQAVIDELGADVDMVVKGGSYVNDSNDVDEFTVGTVYRSLCSDYMGFRIVWN